jgi:anti-sigma factor RsiW
MVHVPDEKLMAFVDGELASEEREWLETLLAADIGLRRRLEPFLVTRATLPIIFDQPMREPIPARLINAISNSGAQSAPAFAAERVIPAHVNVAARQDYSRSVEADPGFFERVMSVIMPAGPSFGPALAYAAVLAVGLGAGWYTKSVTSPGGADDFVIYQSEGLVASGKLQEALNTAQSGQIVTASGEPASLPAIQPVLTFRGLDGQLCRKFQIVASEAKRFTGYACRQDGGAWQVKVHSESLGGTSEVGLSDMAKPSLPPLDGAIDQTIGAQALAPDEEVQLMQNGWSSGVLNSGRN